MNQTEFLTRLNNQLTRLSTEEREDILQDFKEHYLNGLADGKTEEEISASLGNPTQIAKDVLANAQFEKAGEKVSTGNMLRAVWAAIGLSFLNLIFVLGPFIALVAVIFSLWVSGAAFLISPMLALIKYILTPHTFLIFELFFFIAMSGIGVLLLIGMYYATKYTYIGFIRYLKFNAKIVTGGLKHA